MCARPRCTGEGRTVPFLCSEEGGGRDEVPLSLTEKRREGEGYLIGSDGSCGMTEGLLSCTQSREIGQ